MRITKLEHESIVNSFHQIFGQGEIYLFGSRVDDQQKGGDIDLYLNPVDKDDWFAKKISFLVLLKSEIGDQKIDVVMASDSERLIEEQAKKNGIKL